MTCAESAGSLHQIADPVLATGLGDLRASLDFLQDPDHLFFGEFRLLHADILGVELYFQLDRINEDTTILRRARGREAVSPCG